MEGGGGGGGGGRGAGAGSDGEVWRSGGEMEMEQG